jgi:hypothetical protein
MDGSVVWACSTFLMFCAIERFGEGVVSVILAVTTGMLEGSGAFSLELRAS